MCFVAGRILDPVLRLARFWWHVFDLLGCFGASCWHLLLPLDRSGPSGGTFHPIWAIWGTLLGAF